MQNKNKNLIFAETRLVWREKDPRGTAATETEPAASELPSVDVDANIRQAVESNTVGDEAPKIDLRRLREDPNSMSETIDNVMTSWNGSWEKLCSLIEGLFGRSLKWEKIEEYTENIVRAPETAAQQAEDEEVAQEEKKEQERRAPETAVEKKTKISKRNMKRAEHAAMQLAEHPSWKQDINDTAATYGIPASTLVAFIEMESRFNKNSRPGINPKTGRPYSRAIGIAQAMPASIKKYREEMNEDADLLDEATAIDFMGWHIKEIIDQVNGYVSSRKRNKEHFPQSYKLDGSNVEYLYMAYNNGPKGYLVLRRYRENPTEGNKAGLIWFQKRMRTSRAEGEILEADMRANYAARVADVARHYEAIQK